MGDDSGALVIPVETADEVYRVAQEIAYKEAIIEEEVRKGVPLREAREKLGLPRPAIARSEVSWSYCRWR